MRCSSSCRAIATPTWPPPKTTTSSTTPSPGERSSPQAWAASGRADDDEPVARVDHRVAVRDRHRVSADLAHDPRVARDEAALPERLAEHVGVRELRDLELDHLHLTVGEDVGLQGGRNADHAGDRVRRLDLGRDDEVDVEPTLAPELDVLDVRRPDHRRRARCLDPGEGRGDEVRLVA